MNRPEHVDAPAQNVQPGWELYEERKKDADCFRT